VTLGVLAVTALLGTRTVFTAASVMIWPIDPVIESGQRATALWLENRGVQTVTLQIRVLGWSARDYTDHYIEHQRGIIGSPPVATIAPGQRQLVRLTKTEEIPAGQETAYRILIDEIPSAAEATPETAPLADMAAMGVKFRMRYSLPLFAYGPGASRTTGAPTLIWRVVDADGHRWLQVRNDGPIHARLTDVSLTRDRATLPRVNVASGLLGYVLPGMEMRWPLPDTTPMDERLALEAGVNQ
jgi:fimbrial chaperone protein